jgi:FtsZ-interacting cell division protein ZipA
VVTELRWILLGLSLVLLSGIWWWGARRARQMPKDTELRESGLGSLAAGEPGGGGTEPYRAPEPESREWGVSPFEPLSIKTADFDHLQALDEPMTATSDPLDVSLNMDYVQHEVAASAVRNTEAIARLADAEETTHRERPAEPTFGVDLDVDEGAGPRLGLDSGLVPDPDAGSMLELQPVLEARPPMPPRPVEPYPARPARVVTVPVTARPGSPAPSSPPPNASETQRIVTVRVSAIGESRWPGTELLAALEAHGLGFGRYKVFHRKHTDGRTLFCAASLVEPGTFDMAKMPEEEFRGLTLFAVLPGPADALYTIDALIMTAAELAEALNGVVQDSNGAPLSPQRAEALREDVARFQASLSMG